MEVARAVKMRQHSAEHARAKQIWPGFHHSWDQRKRTGTFVTCSIEKTTNWPTRFSGPADAYQLTDVLYVNISGQNMSTILKMIGYVASQQLNHGKLVSWACALSGTGCRQCWCLVKWPTYYSAHLILKIDHCRLNLICSSLFQLYMQNESPNLGRSYILKLCDGRKKASATGADRNLNLCGQRRLNIIAMSRT